MGQQAVVLVATPGKPTNSFKCFGAKPLEDVVSGFYWIISYIFKHVSFIEMDQLCINVPIIILYPLLLSVLIALYLFIKCIKARSFLFFSAKLTNKFIFKEHLLQLCFVCSKK